MQIPARMAPQSFMETHLLPFAPLLARFAGTENFTDDRARGFEAVLRALIAHAGVRVPTRDLVEVLRGARKSGLRNPSKELKLQLDYLGNNLGGLTEQGYQGYEFSLEQSAGSACLRALDTAAGELHREPRQLVVRTGSNRVRRAKARLLKGLTARNVLGWSAAGALEVSCTVGPPHILSVFGLTVARLDEEIRRHIRRHSITDVGYNTLLMGVTSLASSGPSPAAGQVALRLEPMFRSWQLFARAAENRKIVRPALQRGELNALRPLRVALLVRLRRRGEEGFAVLRSNSSLVDPGPWTVTCATDLELFTVDDVDQEGFDLERCAGLILHSQIGLRCRSTRDIQWYGALEASVRAESVEPDSIAPTLLGVVTNKALNLGTAKDDRPLEYETFQYIFSGRRDRQRFHQHSWPGEFWSDEKARQLARDPDSPIDATLRFLLALATLRPTESVGFERE